MTSYACKEKPMYINSIFVVYFTHYETFKLNFIRDDNLVHDAPTPYFSTSSWRIETQTKQIYTL